MTIDEMNKTMVDLGLKLRYRLWFEPETQAIHLATRKPAKITDGYLNGCEITLMKGYRREGLFCVWTSRKVLANAQAKEHGLKVRLLDGEAELWVPAALADRVLPKMGAKIKRTPSEAQKAVLEKMRIASPLGL